MYVSDEIVHNFLIECLRYLFALFEFTHFFVDWALPRLMTTSPLCPFGEPCSTRTHNDLFSAFICIHKLYYDGIRASNLEARSLISNHGLESRLWSECYQFFNRIKNSVIFAVTIVIN